MALFGGQYSRPPEGNKYLDYEYVTVFPSGDNPNWDSAEVLHYHEELVTEAVADSEDWSAYYTTMD